MFSEVNDKKNKKSNRTKIELLNARIFIKSFNTAYRQCALDFIPTANHYDLFNYNNMYHYKNLENTEDEDEDLDVEFE